MMSCSEYVCLLGSEYVRVLGSVVVVVITRQALATRLWDESERLTGVKVSV